METRNVELGRYQFAHVADRGSRRPNSTRVCSSRMISVCSRAKNRARNRAPFRHEIYCYFTLRALPTTIALSWDFLVLPPCRTHISILLHESATPRDFATSRSHVFVFSHPPASYYTPICLLGNERFEETVCAITLFVKHLY